MNPQPYSGDLSPAGPRAVDTSRDPVVIFWELTRSCALACRHCRAEAQPKRHPLELSTEECRSVMRSLTRFDRPPIVVLSGGDPFMRRDLFEIVELGVGLGLTVSVSPSATALARGWRLRKLAELGVSRVSFSLDGPTPEAHDTFRGFPGTFERTIEMFRTAREAGLSFQVNTTVTARTRGFLPRMADLVAAEGAAVWDLFFLVPTGRGQAADLISAEEHENVFNWIADHRSEWPFTVKTTLGMHYRRVAAERQLRANRIDPSALDADAVRSLWPGPVTNDGQGIFFISHTGQMQPSGFLPLTAGNVRRDDVVKMYRDSRLFRSLRDPSLLKGKCGRCPFNRICGGCRARAFAVTGDPFAAEPCCVYTAES
ncbi:MAG: TIGR04053 family radical SAM/SPASM domain-containing protein [Chloroflexota bacterium]